MKILLAIAVLTSISCCAQSPFPKGEVIYERLSSEALKNSGGENPTRRVTIYLPPDYRKTTNRYPVIYYLHGFTWSDSLQIVSDHFDQLLDKAIATGKIKPVIVVLPDQHTLYRGSWYTNSTLTGNWADFTAKDLVNFIDARFRTIPRAEARGVAGHSMGGNGALRMGMLFPSVFSVVYALSPATLGYVKELGPTGHAYKRAQEIKSREELTTGYADFGANAVVAMGRAFSPNPNKPPFYADLPFTYEGNQLNINYDVLELWNKQSLIEMAGLHVDNLLMLKGLKLDWGRNEDNHIPITCHIFSQKLENLGINHYAEEYIGDHTNKLWTDDGRALHDMLPFFNDYLTFEKLKFAAQSTKK